MFPLQSSSLQADNSNISPVIMPDADHANLHFRYYGTGDFFLYIAANIIGLQRETSEDHNEMITQGRGRHFRSANERDTDKTAASATSSATSSAQNDSFSNSLFSKDDISFTLYAFSSKGLHRQGASTKFDTVNENVDQYWRLFR